MIPFDATSFSKDAKIARYAYQYDAIIDLEKIINHLERIKHVDLTALQGDTQKHAFWINVYNGMTNYAIIKYKIQTSMKEDASFFKHLLFKIESLEFSLDDIEHGLLRRNARKHIDASDPKLYHMVDTVDYRIHFALNCGAQSCPAIAFYTEGSLDQELNIAMDSFIQQEFIVNIDDKTIRCSSLFEWYKADFGNQFLNDPKYKDYKIFLNDYDWSI